MANLGANEGYPKAIQSLSNSCHGQSAICGLLSNWIRDLATQTLLKQSGSAGSDPTMLDSMTKDPSSRAAETVRSIAEKVVHGIVMEKYTKDRDDNILRLKKKEVAFLDEMMDSDRWRRLLIDLSAKHKDSALLM